MPYGNRVWFSVQALADHVFGYGGHGIFMVLENSAFFDGAGKEEADPVITVAGYFADHGICKAIETDWLAATGRKVFHLADFGTPACKLGSASWGKPQKVAFLKRLGGIVNREGVYIIGAAVEVSEYAKFLGTAKYAQIFGPAYSACAQLCTHTTEEFLLRQNRLHEKVAYTFEKGDRQHEIAKTVNDYEKRNKKICDLRSLSFLPKPTPLLQPADLIAGTMQHVLLRAFGAIGCLDNGRAFTELYNFERYFSKDGVTASVIPPFNGRILRYVANRPVFTNLDLITEHFEERKPEVVHKRLKQFRNQGKRKKSA